MSTSVYNFYLTGSGALEKADSAVLNLVAKFEGAETMLTKINQAPDKKLAIYEVQPDIIVIRHEGQPAVISYSVLGGNCSTTGQERKQLFEKTLENFLKGKS